MSAAELIKRIAALPPQEKAVFEELYRGLSGRAESPDGKQPAEWPDFTQRLQSIYGDRIAPESDEIISDGRGDR